MDCSIRLKTCEPEFLIATPERLLELVSLKAIGISSVSMLVSKCGNWSESLDELYQCDCNYESGVLCMHVANHEFCNKLFIMALSMLSRSVFCIAFLHIVTNPTTGLQLKMTTSIDRSLTD